MNKAQHIVQLVVGSLHEAVGIRGILPGQPSSGVPATSSVVHQMVHPASGYQHVDPGVELRPPFLPHVGSHGTHPTPDQQVHVPAPHMGSLSHADPGLQPHVFQPPAHFSPPHFAPPSHPADAITPVIFPPRMRAPTWNPQDFTTHPGAGEGPKSLARELLDRSGDLLSFTGHGMASAMKTTGTALQNAGDIAHQYPVITGVGALGAGYLLYRRHKASRNAQF